MFYNYPERTRQIYYPEKVFYMPDVKKPGKYYQKSRLWKRKNKIKIS